MASDFRPRHPISFWMMVFVLIYGFSSGAIAMTHLDDCREHGSATQHWRAWPPEWVCDG